AGSAKGSAYGKRVTALANGLETLQDGVAKVEKLLAGLHGGHDEIAACRLLGSQVRPLMSELRATADPMESLIDDETWPLPKYREMLFVK
ncbi:MAG: hypothetical protein ACKO3S_05110, partial [bacterium]